MESVCVTTVSGGVDLFMWIFVWIFLYGFSYGISSGFPYASFHMDFSYDLPSEPTDGLHIKETKKANISPKEIM